MNSPLFRLFRKEVYWLLFFIGLVGLRQILPQAWGFTSISFVDELAVILQSFMQVVLVTLPFLLIGTIFSALFELFFADFVITNQRGPLKFIHSLAGLGLSLLTPLGEIGSVPFTGKLIEKGWPTAAVVAYFLSVPLINPVGLASVFVITGGSKVFIQVILSAIIIAVFSGLIIEITSNTRRDVFKESLLELPMLKNKSNPSNYKDLKISPLNKAAILSVDILLQYSRLFIIGSILSAIGWLYLSSYTYSEDLAVKILLPFISETGMTGSFLKTYLANGGSVNWILQISMIAGGMLHVQRVVMASKMFQRQALIALIIVTLLLTVMISLIWNFATIG